MYNQTEAVRDKLAADFRAIVADAEELLHVTAGQAGDKAGAVRDRIQQRLRTAKDEIGALEQDAVRRVRDAASATDGYVHQHPWATAGIAAGAALLIGMLISRR
jgi:ElaB/YqjD/DUF883 family membrane-anchored ribosome-binding protein